jgi:hypothetical protein
MQFLNKSSIFKNNVLGDCGYHGHGGLGQTDMREITKICYAIQFGFYALPQNFQHVLKWIEEVSYKS